MPIIGLQLLIVPQCTHNVLLDTRHRRCAVGQYNGLLVVHDSEGSELWSHQLDAPVWTLAWRPSDSGKAANQGSILVACTFGPRIWLFDADEEIAIRSTQLAYDPLYVEFAPKGAHHELGFSPDSLLNQVEAWPASPFRGYIVYDVFQ